MRYAGLFAALAINLFQQPAALALEAREVFKLAEPSVVVVLASDAKGEKNYLGSGVIVAPTEIVTSCRVVEAAADIVVTQGSALRKATLRFKDAERDLCQVHVDDPMPSGKPATIAASAEIETGQELFAIGAPRGMERTIARTMVSGLRDAGAGAGRLMEVDLPLAGGSVGAGMFDQNGRLVGVAAGKSRPGDNANYVAPAEWIAELPKRSADLILNAVAKAAQSSPAQPPAAAPVAVEVKPGVVPRVGDKWKYRLIDGKRPVGVVTIEVIESQGKTVRERVTYESEKGFLAERSVLAEFNPVKFQDVVSLPGGYQLTEIAPYIPLGQDIGAGQHWQALPVTLLMGGYGYGKQKFQMEARVVGREKVRVQAGAFDAVRVQATGQKSMGSDLIKIICNYWYSPDSMRTVKMSLDVKYSNSSFTPNSETYELASTEQTR